MPTANQSVAVPSGADGPRPREGLCQGCLRPIPDPEGLHHKGAACPACGDDVCGCPACLQSLADLRAGVRSGAELGLTSKDDIVWTPEAGLQQETD